MRGLDRLLLLALGLYGVLALTSLALVPRFYLPAEDAVILFQYSRNLAQHGAITFLAGGPHAEGATDFAWMLLVAAAIRCAAAAFRFCALVNILSAVGLAVVLQRVARVHVSWTHSLALVGGCALFPQVFAAASGFAVLPEALLLALLVYFVREQRSACASLLALLLCLFRPDGVVFALPLLVCLLSSVKVRGPALLKIGLVFIVPGALYFLWRWHYFGELLPLPFLVKADAPRVLGLVVVSSVKASFSFLAFAAVVLASLRGRRRGVRLDGLTVALLVVPTAFYWAMRLDQNVGSRFFGYIPLGVALLVATHWPVLGERKALVLRTACCAWAIFLAMPMWREARTFRDMQFPEVKSIAEALGRLPRHGTIATSEAGFLPYYSGWKTDDVWGLDTAAFAHRFVQPPDIARLSPDLVVTHPDRTESCVAQTGWQPAYQKRTWPHLTRNLVLGAGSNYELWLTSYGSEFYRRRKGWRYGEGDRECWLLRKDSAVYAGMAAILTKHHGVPPDESLQMEAVHETESVGDGRKK